MACYRNAPTSTATAIFLKEHLREVNVNDLFDGFRDISRDVMKLQERAAKRWGTQNPYPGIWKI
jgi:hypothetical protein